jgi:hypothetical protein
VALLDDLLVQDLHLADHQQSKIGDEGLRKGIVRDRVALDVDVLVNDICGGRPIHRLGSPVYGLTDVDGSQPDFWAYLHAFLAERGQTFSEWVEQMDLS